MKNPRSGDGSVERGAGNPRRVGQPLAGNRPAPAAAPQPPTPHTRRRDRRRHRSGPPYRRNANFWPSAGATRGARRGDAAGRERHRDQRRGDGDSPKVRTVVRTRGSHAGSNAGSSARVPAARFRAAGAAARPIRSSSGSDGWLMISSTDRPPKGGLYWRSSSRRRNAARPRDSWLFDVPSSMPSAQAISSMGIAFDVVEDHDRAGAGG